MISYTFPMKITDKSARRWLLLLSRSTHWQPGPLKPSRPRRTFSRLLAIALLSAFSFSVTATDDYWVIGSYSEEAEARLQGTPLSEQANVEVLLYEADRDPGPVWRLVTPAPDGAFAQRALTELMAQLGFADVPLLTIDGADRPMETLLPDFLLTNSPMSSDELVSIDSLLAEIEADIDDAVSLPVDGLVGDLAPGPDQTHLVAGSFLNAERAINLASDLAAQGLPATVQATQVAMKRYHRVLLGPLQQKNESMIYTGLAAAGIVDTWRLRSHGMSADSQAAANANQPAPTPPVPTQTVPEESGLAIGRPERAYKIPGDAKQAPSLFDPTSINSEEGYNPAQLRRPDSARP